MITLYKTSKYDKERNRFIKNNPKREETLIRTLSMFVNDPVHPSLNLEKLGRSDVWTIRIDRGNRIFFTWINRETVLLIDIGEHDKYRKY